LEVPWFGSHQQPGYSISAEPSAAVAVNHLASPHQSDSHDRKPIIDPSVILLFGDLPRKPLVGSEVKAMLMTLTGGGFDGESEGRGHFGVPWFVGPHQRPFLYP
jgi:hypothetical protein